MFAKNKNGVEVEYTLELSRDLLQNHNIVASDIIENMYGTKFTMDRVFDESTRRYHFTITTNDPKDEVLTFGNVKY